ncbi:hypothetical protein L150_05437 [Candida albicans Ca529L]|nr:hypothetical protein L150_05437 [Candida albicans Ca529L]
MNKEATINFLSFFFSSLLSLSLSLCVCVVCVENFFCCCCCCCGFL